MEHYQDFREESIYNRQNAEFDLHRRQYAHDYDQLYVVLFDAADMAELGGMVRRLRVDALTLHFHAPC